MTAVDDPIPELRRRAEARLANRLQERPADERDLAVTVHELEVHQIQLEMQNEELRATKLDLERARDRYFALFDLAPVGFVVVDPHGVVQRANRAAGRLLDRQLGALVGRPLTKVLAASQAEIVRRHLLALFADGGPVPLECEVRLGHRGEVVLRLQSQASGPEGWIAMTDVSALRASEAAHARERDFANRLLDVAPLLVVVLDVSGKIVRLNRYAANLTGSSSAVTLGRDWWETFVPESARAESRRAFHEVVAGRRDGATARRIPYGDSGEHLIEWHEAPIVEPDSSVVGVLAVGLDVTETRRLEDRVRQASKMQAVGTLAAGVAHDFNNLLMGVAGVMSIAMKKAPGDVRPMLALVLERVQGGVETVNQLMAFSRRAPHEPVVAVHDSAVSSVLHMLRLLLGEDVSTETQLRAGRARVALGRGEIGQIVTNLAVNARQAMPHGGKLTIESTLVDLAPADLVGFADLQPGRYVRLEVRDTGLGMDAATREQAFEPFFTTKSPTEGTGLGLSTIYGLVERAGGRVELQSRPGAGTLVRLELPLVRDSQVGMRLVQPTIDAGGKTVLVVEDEELVRLAVRSFLEAHGFRVLECRDAQEALEIAEPVDLLISDAVLPGMQGGDLASVLSQRAPSMEVLIISAHPEGYVRERHRIPGGAVFLQKPFDEPTLLRVVSELLGA